MQLPNLVWLVIGAHGPLVGALAMTCRSKGWIGVKDLVRSGFRLRMPLAWWLLILATPAALGFLAVWLNLYLNGFQFDKTLLLQPAQILPTFLIMFFLGGSVQEEFGWRGYALGRLIEKWNPLAASLVLGVVWGVWHLPLFFIQGTSQSFMPFGIFLLTGVCFSLLFTWLYWKTRYNLFSALLLHTAINTALSLFPPLEQKAGGNHTALIYLMLIYALVAIFVTVRDRRFWLNPAQEARSPTVLQGD